MVKKKNQNDIGNKIWWVVFFVFITIITVYSRSSENIKNYPTNINYQTKKYSNNINYSTDTDYKKYTGISSGDNFIVNVDDKQTGERQQYKINNVSASAKQLKDLTMPHMSSANQKYIQQNRELFLQALKAYGFIISNDYQAVKFCAQYYPIDNLKRKFDTRFKEKKAKAVSILTSGFGESGIKNIEISMLSNASVMQMLQKLTEDDYQTVKKSMLQDGVQNFTKTQYCKMLDETADVIVDTKYNDFKTMVPGF